MRDKGGKKWRAYYKDETRTQCHIGYYDDEEEAARALDKAVRDAGLEGKRRTNAVDASGALVPRERTIRRDRSAVVAPDPARAPTATTSKFWGVTWDKKERRWQAGYRDADGKLRHIGRFDDQEAAAHAINTAVRALPRDMQRRRHTNPAVDGQLVPRTYKKKKRPRDEAPPRHRRAPAAASLRFNT